MKRVEDPRIRESTNLGAAQYPQPATLKKIFAGSVLLISMFGCRTEIQQGNIEDTSSNPSEAPAPSSEPGTNPSSTPTSSPSSVPTPTPIACTDPTYGTLDWTQAFASGYYSSLASTPSASSICSGATILGVPGTASCATGASSSVALSDVVDGKTYFNNSGTYVTGALPVISSLDLSNAISIPAGGAKVEAFTGLSRSQVCSTKNFLGSSTGGANCYTGATPPTITVTGNLTFDNAAYNPAKTLTISSSGTAGALSGLRFVFSGDTSQFTIASTSGTTFSHSPSSGALNLPIIVGSSTQSSYSLTVSYGACSTMGQTHSMSVTVTDPYGQAIASLPATATCAEPAFSAMGTLAARFDGSRLSGSAGASVSTWENVAASNNLTASATPPVIATASNGTKLVRFSGADATYMSLASRITSVANVFIVLSNRASLSGGYPSQAYAAFLFDTGNYPFHGGDGTYLLSGWTSSYVTGGTVYVGGTAHTGSTATQALQKSASLNVYEFRLSGGTIGLKELAYGGGYSGRNWNGDIAEVLIYQNSLVSTANSLVIRCYLKTKWGLSEPSSGCN